MIKTITKGITLDDSQFAILQYGQYYVVRKRCSIKNELYEVKLTYSEYFKYYTKAGKEVMHLEHLSNSQRLFLETTCTPAEINCLTKEQKSLDKKLWKSQIKKVLKKSCNKN